MIFQVSSQAGFRNVISRCRSIYRREHDVNMTLVKQIRFWKMNEAGILRVRGYSVTRVTGLRDILFRVNVMKSTLEMEWMTVSKRG